MEPAPFRLLCIEDEADLRDDLLSELRDLGHAPIGAADGLAGLALALSEPFDLILCDMRMPRLDGLEVLAELRRQGGVNGNTPFALLTAYDDDALFRRALALGAARVVLKPVSYAEMDQLVRGLCPPQARKEPS